MRRRLLLFVVFALLAAVVATIAVDLWAGRRVAAELARLETKYGGLEGRSLISPHVAAEENRARVVRAAAALVVRGPLLKGYGVLHASLANFEKTPQSPVPADVQAFIDMNQEAMRVADGARRLHLSSWEADYAGGGNVPPWLTVRDLSNILSFAARLDIKAGRPDDASSRIATGLAVAASMTDEPSLIAQLVRIAIATQQCEAVERLVTELTPSRAALEELAGLLAENRKTDPMRIGLLAELRSTNAMLARMERGDRLPLSESADLPLGPFSRGGMGRLGRPIVRLTRFQYLRDMEALIEAQAGPRPRPPFQGSSRRRLTDPLGLSASGTRGLERAIDSGDTFNSVLDVAQIGVALRRYRLDRGSYPDAVSDLVPAYLSRLPAKPPTYSRSGAGFTLEGDAVRRSGPSTALEWSVSR